MIGPVRIRNYKSIRDLSFEAKRVNVFIGEPNTGKTNIIEALSLFSEGNLRPETLREMCRFRTLADLFFDQQIADPITIDFGYEQIVVEFNKGAFLISHFSDENFQKAVPLDPQAQFANWLGLAGGVRYYRFKENVPLNLPEYKSLTPPFGQNLFTLLHTEKQFRRLVSELFRTRGFRLEIKPVEMQLFLAKTSDDEIHSFPYDSISETWRRVIFYLAVLETNRKSILLLDQPESHTFPYYTNHLAERIALDDTNQFFITTHSPYILSSIVGKTAVKDLAVFVTSIENFATKIKPVTSSGLFKILEFGQEAFLNLEKLVEA